MQQQLEQIISNKSQLLEIHLSLIQFNHNCKSGINANSTISTLAIRAIHAGMQRNVQFTMPGSLRCSTCNTLNTTATTQQPLIKKPGKPVCQHAFCHDCFWKMATHTVTSTHNWDRFAMISVDFKQKGANHCVWSCPLCKL